MAKDPSRITAGEMQKKVEIMGSENLFRNVSNSTNINKFFEEEKKMVSPKKTISSIFSCQTQLKGQKGLASMVRCNKKLAF